MKNYIFRQFKSCEKIHIKFYSFQTEAMNGNK
ncbi:hypothetical protein RCH18_001497 [Flavobacterium sp. PL11]|jgi:hypothetical protein|nr:hypothetical protein [Flavobacterium sp. PL11]